jgi:hypothetical protein
MFPCFGYDEPRWFYDWEVEKEPRTAVMNKIEYPTNTGPVQYGVIIRNRNRPLMVISSVLRIHNSFSPKQIKDPALVKFAKTKTINQLARNCRFFPSSFRRRLKQKPGPTVL